MWNVCTWITGNVSWEFVKSWTGNRWQDNQSYELSWANCLSGMSRYPSRGVVWPEQWRVLLRRYQAKACRVAESVGGDREATGEREMMVIELWTLKCFAVAVWREQWLNSAAEISSRCLAELQNLPEAAWRWLEIRNDCERAVNSYGLAVPCDGSSGEFLWRRHQAEGLGSCGICRKLPGGYWRTRSTVNELCELDCWNKNIY